MVSERKELTIKAGLLEIDKAKAFIEDELVLNGCPADVRGRIELALEEMLVNVVSYAYPEGEGFVKVAALFPKSNVIQIEIIDEGVPYDPTMKPDPDVTRPLKERPKGGLGIFMAKKVMDDMTYDHKDGFNHTILIKKFK